MDDSVGDSTVATPSNSTEPVLALPWVEKYRPVVLDDVVGNVDSLNKLKAIAKQGNLPNLIITGPPGTGKTTSVLALAREMLGPRYKDAVLELNASDARGIDTIRDQIKQFAQLKVTLPPGKHKLVILDEADSMTKGAQQALRRTMELFSHTTRFALACNTSSKIIEPIQSRCAILRFTRLDDDDLRKRINTVMISENITSYDDSGIKALLFTSQGDMRQALNNLQSTYSSAGTITSESVYAVVDQPHPDRLHDILKHCSNHRLRDAINILEVLYFHGYSPSDIISTLFQVCKYADINEHKRLEYIRHIGTIQMRIADGCESLLQLTSLLSQLSLITDDILYDSLSCITLAGK